MAKGLEKDARIMAAKQRGPLQDVQGARAHVRRLTEGPMAFDGGVFSAGVLDFTCDDVAIAIYEVDEMYKAAIFRMNDALDQIAFAFTDWPGQDYVFVMEVLDGYQDWRSASIDVALFSLQLGSLDKIYRGNGCFD